VVKVKPRQDKAFAFDLLERKIEYYLPMYTKVTRRKDNNKPRKSIMPLFPGYVSICADKNSLWDLFSTGRVVQFVEVKDQKRFAEQLALLYTGIRENADVMPVTTFTAGERVRVTFGPMRGCEAEVVTVHGQKRVVVKLEALGFASMSIAPHYIEPVG